MTALTATEISTSDIIQSEKSGTASKRIKIFVRGHTGSTSDGPGVLDLATPIPGLQDIEGVTYASVDSVERPYATGANTAVTFTSTSITINMKGVCEIGLIARMN